jgi:molecular chaperone DnaK
MEKQQVCIGIDLGTTNSEVACIRNGQPVLIPVEGSKIVPSVVSVDEQGSILIGQSAVNNELAAPLQTIRWIKRKMGKEEILSLNGQSYTPAMVSSLILKRLKLAAEEFLGHSVAHAVITVPAFFNEKQREATKEAALLAGLEPLRLLNEPTAAALAYTHGSKKTERCLVYDLGGGTFDVSIVDLSRDLMEVRSSHGDTELGGADLDKFIAERARQQFLEQHNIDLAHNPSSWARLLRAAEAAKIRLSTEADALLSEEFIAIATNGEPLHLNFLLMRTEFERMIRSLIERSLLSVHKALEMAAMTAADLDRVILVGGSTYIPLVVEMLEADLKIAPQASLNPSTVVALGAAMEAATLSGEHLGPMMVDVTPHSLGISCLNAFGENQVHCLIHRNTPVPTTASHVFRKIYDDQDGVEIEVFQGESPLPSQCQCLGKFRLDGLADSPSDEIHVKFELDRSGIVHATVTDIALKKKTSHTLKKISHSRVKNVSLADVESVRIAIHNPTFVEEVSDIDTITWQEEPGMLKIGGENSLAFSSGFSEKLQQLIAKAQILIDHEQLSAADKVELSNEMALTHAGDTAAAERLENLLYYLE